MAMQTYTYKIVDADSDLVEQYYALRGERFTEAKGSGQYRYGSNKKDQSSRFILALNESNRVVAGVRLQIIEPGDQDLLSFQEKSTTDYVANLLPGIDITDYRRAELRHLVANEEAKGDPRVTKGLITYALQQASTLQPPIDVTFMLPIQDMLKEKFMRRCFEDGRAQGELVFLGQHKLMSGNFRETEKKDCYALVNNADIATRLKSAKDGYPIADQDAAHYFLASPLGAKIKGQPLAGVIFDWDNVVTDSHAVAEQCFKEAMDWARDQGIPCLSDSFVMPEGDDFLGLAKRIFGEENGQKVFAHGIEIYKERIASTPAMEGALETFKMLKEAQIPVAIVSNAKKAFIDPLVRNVLGELYSDITYFSNDETTYQAEREKHTASPQNLPVFFESRKPDVTNVRRALEVMGIPEGRWPNVAFCGDTFKKDIYAAEKLGLRPVLFGHGGLSLISHVPDQEHSASRHKDTPTRDGDKTMVEHAGRHFQLAELLRQALPSTARAVQ